ncbi:DNA-methyltransferase [Methanofollis fontis]|uniref:Type II methyltransferase n=1 Tax=Methanofollis fontis TaxID=2052832 RepID=A0A483CZC6_9EURY|nr:site-specific DNA-methyltransferase [Methanofollis fontis]TAJ45419.1 site-specific DNA-methyltransferase [Methanofollis fontis]
MEPVITPYGRFYNQDCVTGARAHLASGSVDLIVTDPPYGIDGDRLHRHYNRDETCVVGGYVEVPAGAYGEFSLDWILEAERVLRPGGSIYIVSGYTNLYHILHALRQTSLREVNHIIWKYNFGVYTRKKYISSHYHILFYEKPGGRRTFNLECRYGANEASDDGGSLNYRDREDVWAINRHYKPGMVKNKNELPTALLGRMIQYSSDEGDLVCDLFLGGCSTARTAIGLNRRTVGFEVSETIFAKRAPALAEITPGDLLASLRQPVIDPLRNQGKRWSRADLERLERRYAELRDGGKTRKASIAVLQQEFGRGRWSLERALKRTGDGR